MQRVATQLGYGVESVRTWAKQADIDRRVAPGAGPAYAFVCFIIDAYSRMVVGWWVAPHTCTETVLDAIEMAPGPGAHATLT